MGKFLGTSAGNICGDVLAEFNFRPDALYACNDPACVSTTSEAIVLGGAFVNDEGFPLYLAAVTTFLMQKERRGGDPIVQLAARKLADRQPENPFFQFLAKGATQEVIEMTVKQCPSQSRLSNSKFQWSWERADTAKAALDSMYWDCLFMVNLLRKTGP